MGLRELAAQLSALRKRGVTYWGGGARRSVATCVAHRLALVPRGTRVLLGVLAGRDNHGRVGIASLHTLVVRDVLGIVLTISKQQGIAQSKGTYSAF